MNINYYDLFYTVKKIIDEKLIVMDEEYNNSEKDLINYNDFIIPNHHVGIEPRETILS